MADARLKRTRAAYGGWDDPMDPTFRPTKEVPSHIKEWVTREIQKALDEHKRYAHMRDTWLK